MREKRLMGIIALILVVLSCINAVTMMTITGRTVSSVTGQVMMCVNYPPTINEIATQRGHFNTNFTYKVNASDPGNGSLTYYDNTSLFVINESTGLINITPFRTDIGVYPILITVADAAIGCALNASTSFILDVNNSVPVLGTSFPSLQWEQNVWLTGYDLDDYFSDFENDSLNYTAVTGGYVTVEIDNNPSSVNKGKITLKPQSNWAGVTWVQFIANDSVNITYSNNITLNVTGDTVLPLITINKPRIFENSTKLSFVLNISISETGSLIYDLDGLGNITLCSSCTDVQIGINVSDTVKGFGNHSLLVYATDVVGNINMSALNFTLGLDTDGDGISDEFDLDDDNDGVANSVDFLNGNVSNINGNIARFNLTVDGSFNTSAQFSSMKKINITNITNPLVEFDYDFSLGIPLSLGNITILKQSATATKGSIIVKGINLTAGAKKTIYIDNIDIERNSVCVKDKAVTSLSEISINCTGESEVKVPCNGSITLGFTCTDLGAQYRITGLSHSAAVEVGDASGGSGSGSDSGSGGSGGGSGSGSSGSSSGGGGGGGGGGSSSSKTVTVVSEKLVEVLQGAVCTYDQKCPGWGICSSTQTQTRNCIEVRSNCKVIEVVEQQACVCKPQWECTGWNPESCQLGEIQQRACRDVNGCGIAVNLPLGRGCGGVIVQQSSLNVQKSVVGSAFSFGTTEGRSNLMLLVLFLFLLFGMLVFLFLLRRRERKNVTINIGKGKVELFDKSSPEEMKKHLGNRSAIAVSKGDVYIEKEDENKWRDQIQKEEERISRSQYKNAAMDEVYKQKFDQELSDHERSHRVEEERQRTWFRMQEENLRKEKEKQVEEQRQLCLKEEKERLDLRNEKKRFLLEKKSQKEAQRVLRWKQRILLFKTFCGVLGLRSPKEKMELAKENLALEKEELKLEEQREEWVRESARRSKQEQERDTFRSQKKKNVLLTNEDDRRKKEERWKLQIEKRRIVELERAKRDASEKRWDDRENWWKDFFHTIGLYKTSQEKQRDLELREQEQREKVRLTEEKKHLDYLDVQKRVELERGRKQLEWEQEKVRREQEEQLIRQQSKNRFDEEKRQLEFQREKLLFEKDRLQQLKKELVSQRGLKIEKEGVSSTYSSVSFSPQKKCLGYSLDDVEEELRRLRGQ